MKKLIMATTLAALSLYGANLPKYEIRPNVSNIHFGGSNTLEDGFTYGVDFAAKVNDKYMASLSYKRENFDFDNINDSTHVDVYMRNTISTSKTISSLISRQVFHI